MLSKLAPRPSSPIRTTQGVSLRGIGPSGTSRALVQVLSRRPTERGLFFDASDGTQETMNFDLLLSEAPGPFRISLEGNYFSTGGDDVVKSSRRGSIDIEADSNH
jgi:hypothetical protein